MFKSIELFATQDQLVESMKPNERYVLFISEGTTFAYEKLPDGFNYYGAIFPYVIFEGNYYINGIVAVMLKDEVLVSFLSHMYEQDLEHIITEESKSLFVIVDGLSSHIVEFLENLFEVTPMHTNMLGGGAGKLTLKQEPVIFDNKTIHQDSALILSATYALGVGVNHGWQKLHGPLIANKTTKNILQELNYEDAFVVYKQIVEQDSGAIITPENFFDIAKSYPLGITKYGSEVIVRDPIMTDGKELVLVGEMDANSVVTVLKGNKELLINAAGVASIDAQRQFIHDAHSCLVVDCISRVLFLEDDFERELQSIQKNMNKPLQQWGMLTLGEIANINKGNIEFYNKTCVVGVL